MASPKLTQFVPSPNPGGGFFERKNIEKVKHFCKKVFTPVVRERLYIVAAALMTVLVSFGVMNDNQAALWSSLVVAIIGAVFAIVNAETNWRVALYTVAGAAAALFQGYGILGDANWAAITGLVAAVLGVSTAAAKAPTTGAAM